MYEWNERVQIMVDRVKEHLDSEATLHELSERLGYLPYYCTRWTAGSEQRAAGS